MNKKKLLIVCVAIMVMIAAVTLIGCAHGDADDMTLADVNKMLVENPQIFEMRQSIKVNALSSTSHLSVAKKNGKFLAKYEYSTQKYSVITPEVTPGNAILTETGVKYYNGMQVGTLVDNSVVWGDEKPVNITKVSIRLSEEVLEGGYTLSDGKDTIDFDGKVKADKVEKILGIKGSGAVALKLSFNEKSKSIEVIRLTYSKGVNNCDIVINIGYTPCSVEIPGALANR